MSQIASDERIKASQFFHMHTKYDRYGCRRLDVTQAAELVPCKKKAHLMQLFQI